MKAHGTAAQKAEFFESMLEQVHGKTDRSFNFTVIRTQAGHFIFAGDMTKIRVIDSDGGIFKGTLQNMNPSTNEPNFQSLTRIK